MFTAHLAEADSAYPQLQLSEVKAVRENNFTERVKVLGSGSEVISWAAKEVLQSCKQDTETRKWQSTLCRDWSKVPIRVDGFKRFRKNVTCESVKDLCGRGLNLETYCPQTCGLCSGNLFALSLSAHVQL